MRVFLKATNFFASIRSISCARCSENFRKLQRFKEQSNIVSYRPRLVVLLLANPHLLEGGERGEDRTADPDGVLSLRRRDDLDLHRAAKLNFSKVEIARSPRFVAES